MPVTVVRPRELDDADRRRWHELQRTQRRFASPFLSPEFAEAVDRVRDDARVAVVDADGRRVAFWPFQLAGDEAAEPLGAGVSDAQAVVADPAWRWDAGWLLRAAGLRAWRFDHLVVDQPELAAAHHRRVPAPTIDLSAGFDAYVEAVAASSRRAISDTRRRRRRLEREWGPVAFTWHDPDPAALERTLAAKSAQFRATGTWDRFARRWIRELVTDLVTLCGPGLTGTLATLSAGSRTVASHVGLVGHGVLCWWFPVYDPELARSAPGRVLLLELAAAAAQRGLHTIDLGKGAHDYKLRFATGHTDVAEGEVRA